MVIEGVVAAPISGSLMLLSKQVVFAQLSLPVIIISDLGLVFSYGRNMGNFPHLLQSSQECFLSPFFHPAEHCTTRSSTKDPPFCSSSTIHPSPGGVLMMLPTIFFVARQKGHLPCEPKW
jgi:hypothetical protein